MPTRLPLAARLILRLTLPKGDREFLAGDVEEDYARARSAGRIAGMQWLTRQVLGAVAASLALRTKHIRNRFAPSRWARERAAKETPLWTRCFATSASRSAP